MKMWHTYVIDERVAMPGALYTLILWGLHLVFNTLAKSVT